MKHTPLVNEYVVLSVGLCLIFSVLTEICHLPTGWAIAGSIWLVWGFALVAHYLSQKDEDN